jgi:hypothetical protein
MHKSQTIDEFNLEEFQNKIIMQSQRAIFSLKGTNINLPNRYKIRKYKPGKTKSDKPEKE